MSRPPIPSQAAQSAQNTVPSPGAGPTDTPIVCLVIGMAGSGKTTLMQVGRKDSAQLLLQCLPRDVVFVIMCVLL